jgi:hypothetical protein
MEKRRMIAMKIGLYSESNTKIIASRINQAFQQKAIFNSIIHLKG